jgi:hypothetical protein
MALTMLWIVLPAMTWSVIAWVIFDQPPRTVSRVVAAVRRRWARREERPRGQDRRDEVRLDPGPLDERPPVLGGHSRRARCAAPDPFDVLVVQVQLGRLSAQLRALEADPHAWARGRRILATQAAYDALLAEACRLAGVPVEQEWSPEPWGPTREPERFREEIELASRGWSW